MFLADFADYADFIVALSAAFALSSFLQLLCFAITAIKD
jgi:hypothetical protein